MNILLATTKLGVFSSFCYRWSYGILLYEILTVSQLSQTFIANVLLIYVFLLFNEIRLNGGEQDKEYYTQLCRLDPYIAYIITVYTLCHLGGSPYPHINARQIAEKLQQGYRMPKPSHVDEKL